jgi:hypothetical protein
VHIGPFLEKVEKYVFWQFFFHLKLKIWMSNLKTSFRFVFRDPKLVGIDTHIAIVSGFDEGPVRNLPPVGPGLKILIRFGFLDPKLV